MFCWFIGKISDELNVIIESIVKILGGEGGGGKYGGGGGGGEYGTGELGKGEGGDTGGKGGGGDGNGGNGCKFLDSTVIWLLFIAGIVVVI